MVYVARNPKDACVSYYHHYKHVFGDTYQFKGGFEDFAEHYKKGYVNYGSYWAHIKVRLLLKHNLPTPENLLTCHI